MTDKPGVYVDGDYADWLKAWDLPNDATAFLRFLARRAKSEMNDDIAREWLRFQQEPAYKRMPADLQSQVIALLESGSYGPVE
jgi:hypothetical protein